MKRTSTLIGLAAMLGAQLVSAPAPRLIRGIDLNQVIPVPRGYVPATTFTFSPDEQWLAVTFSPIPLELNRNTGLSGSERVLLIPLAGRTNQHVQINPGLFPLGNAGWSPNSESFFVLGSTPGTKTPHGERTLKVWNLSGEELLHRDGFPMDMTAPSGIFGFIDLEHLLVRGESKKRPHDFAILDLHGQVVDTWTASKQCWVVDISPGRHLLAVMSDERASKIFVVDYPAHKIVQTKTNPNGGRWDYFTEGGKTLCSVGSAAPLPTRDDTRTQCWDVDSGNKVAQFDGFLGGAPAAASSRGSRLLLTSVARKKPLRVAWDFRSGTEVAAWEIPQVSWSNPSGGPGFIKSSPVAISSTGRYAAEVNGTLLRIYELL